MVLHVLSVTNVMSAEGLDAAQGRAAHAQYGPGGQQCSLCDMCRWEEGSAKRPQLSAKLPNFGLVKRCKEINDVDRKKSKKIVSTFSWTTELSNYWIVFSHIPAHLFCQQQLTIFLL